MLTNLTHNSSYGHAVRHLILLGLITTLRMSCGESCVNKILFQHLIENHNIFYEKLQFEHLQVDVKSYFKFNFK